MTFFLDANIFIYAATDDPLQDVCAALLERVGRGDAAGTTSVAVVEEVWHFELTRGGPRAAGLARDALDVVGSALPVTRVELELALTLAAGDAGSNDRLHAATCIVNSIPAVVSADRDFDEFEAIRRVDPGDEQAVAELLAG